MKNIILRGTRKTTEKLLTDNGKMVSKGQEIAEILINYFINTVSKMDIIA